MLDWLGERHAHPGAVEAGRRIEAAVDRAYACGLKSCEFGGSDGTAAVAAAVLGALDSLPT
jgi:3-isopropylmalate dehydrogenase